MKSLCRPLPCVRPSTLRIRAVCRRLDDATRDTILRLKYETPENEGIHGVEYYQAVLEGGVRTLDELRRWRAAHPLDGVNLWMP